MALRDWLHSGPVATATAATVATKQAPRPRTVASVASVAVAEPRKSDPAPFAVALDIDTPAGPRSITDATTYTGRPTPEAVDVADAILTHLATEGHPVTEAEILDHVGGDPIFCRNTLYRLACEGLAEYRGGGLYAIPPWPLRPVNLPESCPLRTGGEVPDGCRFEARLFARMVREGALPLPGGRCPLRIICEELTCPEN